VLCQRRQWARQAAPTPGCSLTGSGRSSSERSPDSCPTRIRCTGLSPVSFLTRSPNYPQAGSHTPNKGLLHTGIPPREFAWISLWPEQKRETTEVSPTRPPAFPLGTAGLGRGLELGARTPSAQGPSSCTPLSSQATQGLYRAAGP